jgi:putative oxidoreductase
MRWLNRFQPLGLLVLRLAVGAVFIGYGWQKVHGGMAHWVAGVTAMGFPRWAGYVAAWVELAGGAALILGFLTRLAALGLLANMIVALWKVKLHGPFWAGGSGSEFPLVCGAICFALIFFGAGPWSLDAKLFGGGAPPKPRSS